MTFENIGLTCRTLGEGISNALIRNQLPSGTLYDTWDRAPTPDSHYANAFLVLALVRRLRRRFHPPLLNALEKSLAYLARLPENRKGHREFNQYAFLSARMELQRADALSPEIRQRIRRQLDALIQPRFDAGPHTPHGNNWIALQGLDLLLMGRLRASPSLEDRGRRLLLEALSRQGEDGVFADFPRSPRSRLPERLTPQTYHAATCFLLLKALPLFHPLRAERTLARALTVLAEWVDEEGKFAPFGRSNHSLFGTVCALAALWEGSEYQDVRRASGSRPDEWRRAALRLTHQLRRLVHRDGSLLLNPGSKGGERRSWDHYMHHSVYNAFAAALLLDPVLDSGTPLTLPLPDPVRLSRQFRVYRDSGLVVARSTAFRLLFSLEGQRSTPRFELDPRCAGMTLVALCAGGCNPIPPPPPPPPMGRPLLPPGFLPILAYGGRRYHPYTWEVMHLTMQEGERLEVRARAVWSGSNPWRSLQERLQSLLRYPLLQAMRLEPLARRWRPGAILNKAAELRTPSLPVWFRTVVIHLHPLRIEIRDRVENRTSFPALVHPWTLRLDPDFREWEGGIQCSCGEQRLSVRFDPAAPRWTRDATVPTALGPARIRTAEAQEIPPAHTRHWRMTLFLERD